MNSYYATIGEKLNNLLPPPVTTTPALLDLFRYSIDSGIVFSDWKIARITPVHKKDDESYGANYRPISLLSIPSKLLESEANDNIVQHVFKENNLASDRQTNQICFVHADHLKATGGDTSWGSVACSRKSSRAEELVESQAAEEDCLVLPEPLPSEFSTPREENSPVADKAEEQLVPKETQDSVLGDTLRGTSTPGLPSSPQSVPRYPRRERKTVSRLICEI